MSDRRAMTVEMLADIDRLIKAAESLTVAKRDNDTLHRASTVLAGLRKQRRDVEARLMSAVPVPRFSFSIRDLFLTMTVVALLLRLVISVARK